LNEAIWKAATSFGFAQVFIPQYKWTMIDDPVSLAQRLTLKTWLEQTPP